MGEKWLHGPHRASLGKECVDVLASHVSLHRRSIFAYALVADPSQMLLDWCLAALDGLGEHWGL